VEPLEHNKLRREPDGERRKDGRLGRRRHRVPHLRRYIASDPYISTVCRSAAECASVAQTLAGARTGTKTDEQQIRLSYSQYFRPMWQGVLSISHDVSEAGGFRQDFGLFLRIAKVF
jgi:hypothetical protein